MDTDKWLVGADACILVTGAGGFIGKRVVAQLLQRGFTNMRCLARPPANSDRLRSFLGIAADDTRVEIVEGNLLSRDDCLNISADAQLIYHLAAGRGQKSYSDAYLNSVVTTRNLLDACLTQGCLRRFVSMSSFTVYTNRGKATGRVLDETCPLELHSALRGDPYCFAKVKQEEMIMEYGKNHDVPYTIIRPGVVYGPGNEKIHGRVGMDTFGIFLHLGGSNELPLSFVDNCADAMILAGIVKGIDGEAFNVVDDDLPSSRRFLRAYKQLVKRFQSIPVPRFLSYILCYLWESYSVWSQGQLPNSFNRKDWSAAWQKSSYTNEKIKSLLGWRQRIPTSDGLKIYFESCREKIANA